MAKAKPVRVINNGSFGGIFLVTYVGAAVYFVEKANGFWDTIWAMIQALVWPGFVVYHLMIVLKV